jgi:predicted transcriptional regulator
VTENNGAAMPPPNSLSEPQEALLFAIWKLRGMGNNPVTEEQLRAETTNQPTETFPSALGQLQSQGFIEVVNKSGRKGIAITPLGVAILRKVEEDRLQEIK